jgi:ABC-2 type transport system ATP-binding protein
MRRVGLPEEAFKRREKSFSKGMRQRLGIAIAIMKDAKLVLLDEPTSGLDPRGGAEFLELLRGLKSEGKAIFMSTHDIFRAKQIADRLGIMTMGNLATVLDRAQIRQADLEQLYFKYVEAYEAESAAEAAVGAGSVEKTAVVSEEVEETSAEAEGVEKASEETD